MNKIEQIKSELKRLKNDWASLDDELTDTMVAEYDYLLDFLSTLESEQPVPKDLEEAAHLFSESPEPLYSPGHRFHWDDDALFGKQIEASFIAGAKWQADHTPLPEDTVLFNKGVAEGKRLMMEEAVEADVNIYRDLAAGKSWAEFVVERPTNNLGEKVRIIIVKED